MAESSTSQNINDLGEEQIIRLFSGSPLPKETIGIGDDCAVIKGPDGLKRLISTDLLIEDVHFRLDSVGADDLGHKALAVNLSDIAAMGGMPDGFFLSIALPGTLSMSWLNEFRSGLNSLALQYDIPLFGGDTTRSEKHLMISITILGVAEPNHLKLRNAAKPGDHLCVTGPLGDSAAGLAVLSYPGKYHTLSDNHRNTLVEKHYRPEPVVHEGQWLGRQDAVRSMIDLSDGLLNDARHIAGQSGCGIDIALDQLPLSSAFKAFACIEDTPEQVQEFAAVGGEDYQLLLSVAETHISDLKDQFREKFGKPLYDIGKVTKGEPKVNTLRAGSSVEVSKQEFKHFNRS